MTSQQLELITRRGLTLPEPTLTRLRTVGIWCEANLTLQRRDQDWLIDGQESTKPNRSATDTRNVTPRANRRRIRANCKIRSFIIIMVSQTPFPLG